MYISLRDSQTHGFNKWAAANDIKDPDPAMAAAEAAPVALAAQRGATAMPPTETQRPWLVPGVGSSF